MRAVSVSTSVGRCMARPMWASSESTERAPALSPQTLNSWATVSLKEGKNREIKRVMERLGLKVSRLIRTAYGPFQLGQLAEGQVEEIPSRLWREKLGIGRKKRADRDDQD